MKDGCAANPSCFTCPLPDCCYRASGPRAARNAMRDLEMLALRKAGATADEVARQYGLSRRTVFRVQRVGQEVESQA